MQHEPSLGDIFGAVKELTVRVDGLTEKVDGLSDQVSMHGEAIQALATHIDDRFRESDQQMTEGFHEVGLHFNRIDRQLIAVHDRMDRMEGRAFIR